MKTSRRSNTALSFPSASAWRRGPADGPFVFGAFSSHLYRSHTIVLVLAVSG